MGIALFFLFLAGVYCLWHLCGFVLGHSYDYQNRCKSYNGTKVIISGLVIWAIWSILPFL